MNSLNSIVLEGNLTKDADHLTTPKGTEVCRFSVASNRYYQQDDQKKEEVSFFEIEAWGRTAETCKNLAKKGRGCRIVGRLKQDRYVDSEGKNQYRVKIVADHLEFKPLTQKASAAGASARNTPMPEALPAF